MKKGLTSLMRKYKRKLSKRRGAIICSWRMKEVEAMVEANSMVVVVAMQEDVVVKH